jgi:hypothetical protein
LTLLQLVINFQKYPILIRNNRIVSLKIVNKLTGIVKINFKSSFYSYEKNI